MFDPATVRVYGADTSCLMLQQKLGFALCSLADDLLLQVLSRFLQRRITPHPLAKALTTLPVFVQTSRNLHVIHWRHDPRFLSDRLIQPFYMPIQLAPSKRRQSLAEHEAVLAALTEISGRRCFDWSRACEDLLLHR